jgi:hypothetical protein
LSAAIVNLIQIKNPVANREHCEIRKSKKCHFLRQPNIGFALIPSSLMVEAWFAQLRMQTERAGCLLAGCLLGAMMIGNENRARAR